MGDVRQRRDIFKKSVGTKRGGRRHRVVGKRFRVRNGLGRASAGHWWGLDPALQPAVRRIVLEKCRQTASIVNFRNGVITIVGIAHLSRTIRAIGRRRKSYTARIVVGEPFLRIIGVGYGLDSTLDIPGKVSWEPQWVQNGLHFPVGPIQWYFRDAAGWLINFDKLAIGVILEGRLISAAIREARQIEQRVPLYLVPRTSVVWSGNRVVVSRSAAS